MLTIPRPADQPHLADRAGMIVRRLRALGPRQALAVSLLAGIADALALPPIGLVPLVFAALPVLLILVEMAPSRASACWRGFAFGVGYHLAGLYWITNAILIMAAEFWWFVPFAVPLTAAVLALFIVPACLAARVAAPGWRRVLLFAGVWTLGDLARQFVLTGFPWNPLGSIWALQGRVGDAFIQPAAWVGVPGLTMLTVLLATAPRLGRGATAGALLGLTLWGALGTARLLEPPPQAPGLHVILVQGDIAEGQTQDRAWALATFQRYLTLTREAVGAATRDEHAGEPLVVIWPETASPFLLTTDIAARAAVAQAADPAIATLSGTIRFAADGTPRNSFAVVGRDGALGPIYDKSHLVPFGEYEPSWMPLKITPGGGFAPGGGVATLRYEGLPPFGPLICYEAIFPGEVTDRGNRPAWLVNVTNDAWFGDSAGPRQHLEAARLRAVEEGLPVMRAANSGISAGFDARGHELGRLGMNRAGTLSIDLPGARPATAFARLGLVIPGLLAALGCLAAVIRGRGPGATKL